MKSGDKVEIKDKAGRGRVVGVFDGFATVAYPDPLATGGPSNVIVVRNHELKVVPR